MAWIRVPGRKFQNTETGEIITRRQFDKLRGISFEKKAAENRAKDLGLSLSRPARGRKKVVSKEAIERRVEQFKEAQEVKRTVKLERLAKLKGSKIRPKKIRKQLLVAGHFAERIGFTTHEQFEDLRSQMLSQKAPNGKPLIFGYTLGIVGIDDRTGAVVYGWLASQRTPRTDIDEEEFDDLTDEFINEHAYFIPSNYFLHLRFNSDYAKEKLAKKNRKNLPPKTKK